MKLKLLLLNVLVFTMALLPASIYAAGQPTELTNVTVDQETNELSCRGQMWGYRATITGLRQYEEYIVADEFYGRVQFSGEMRIGSYRLLMTYEDYTNLAPYEGVLQFGRQRYYFKIIDSMEKGRMTIYESRETLYAPAILGEFTCNWR